MNRTFMSMLGRGLALGLVLLASALQAIAKDYKYQTVKGDPMKSRIYTLDNGLKVYLSVNKEKPRIQTYIAVRTGSKSVIARRWRALPRTLIAQLEAGG